MMASACDFFPERTDLEFLIGEGVSPSHAAKKMSAIEGRIDDWQHLGTKWDTLPLTPNVTGDIASSSSKASQG